MSLARKKRNLQFISSLAVLKKKKKKTISHDGHFHPWQKHVKYGDLNLKEHMLSF